MIEGYVEGVCLSDSYCAGDSGYEEFLKADSVGVGVRVGVASAFCAETGAAEWEVSAWAMKSARMANSSMAASGLRRLLGLLCVVIVRSPIGECSRRGY